MARDRERRAGGGRRQITLGWSTAWVLLVITTLEGWLLTPVLLGKAARMNTLAVFLGLLAWSWVWGVWGTLLAVPMLAALKSVCDHVESVHPVSELLAE
jgi:predicted PurR-regulated permease PerM